MAYKIIQWPSGNVGKNSIATIAARKGLKLAGLNVTLDDIEEMSSTALANEPISVSAGELREGTVAGQHWEWAGMSEGKKLIVHETVWRMHDSVGKKWPQGNHSITIEGKPGMFVEFGPDWNNDVLLSTAVHAVNAVPYVCDATSGIRTLLDLPMIVARGGHVIFELL